ncbi:hypothetical protein N7451_001362 [Penicillium sp. IBT 35674x]|nr:hypothetical protein N7451_001362 [Penicillium sp. IBT 35674x]
MEGLEKYLGAVSTRDLKNDKRILLVLLTVLLEEDKQALIRQCQDELPQDVKVLTWTPQMSLLQHISRQSLHRDSQDNIHAIAALMHRNGLSKFVVADELSRRQLRKNSLDEKVRLISLILVAVRPKPTPAATVQDFCVVIKRTNHHKFARMNDLVHALEDNRLNIEEQKDNVTFHFQKYRKVEWMIIYDPDNKPFSIDSSTSPERPRYIDTVFEVLSTKKNLPMEVIHEIISYSDTSSNTPSGLASSLYDRQTKKHLPIFALFTAEREQLEKMQFIIQKALDAEIQLQQLNNIEMGELVGSTIELVPQEHHGIVSRRDLLALWKQRRREGRDVRPVIFVYHPITEENISSAQFGTCNAPACSEIFVAAMIFRMSFHNFLRFYWGERKRLTALQAPSYTIEGAEFLHYSDEPFWHQPPAQLPEGEEYDPFDMWPYIVRRVKKYPRCSPGRDHLRRRRRQAENE